ncbi:VCBS repeat-containing protein [Streptomyces sp. 8K308]|uniref:FG-GAP-like repeat-containing protein n=1 Tax=Streptomyces sp. 8K308 TaxID=2530388 RepID=UPI00104D70B8|nr:FG-GAP-like repeat-containing protein [Streptomyces sp. 8K308]TDC22184.1 VCBS repeat-containing protein [Streptomyces sp. 8K308]
MRTSPRHRARATLVLAVATVATAAGVVPLTATPAGAAPPGVRDDFDGDGYRDLAIAAPHAPVDGQEYAGAVVVVPGSAGAPRAAATTLTSQSGPGVPGASEEGDAWGAALAAGDFDGDGRADLAVGAPGEDTAQGVDVGAVTVLWGGASGLGGGTALATPASPGLTGFGGSLAAGDFDGDGVDDLAVGQQGTNDVWIHRGGSGFSAAPAGFAATALTDSLAGVATLAAGDINGDGTDDLVVGGDNLTARDYFRNAVYLSPGSAARRTYAGLAGHGTSAAVGDIDGDGRADVVTGHPREPDGVFQGTSRGGNVTVTYGAAGGLATSRAPVVIHQNTAGVPGAAEPEDQFGASVALGDIDGDGHADLVVGADQENIGTATFAGAVTVFHGSAAGLDTTTSYPLHQNTADVPGGAEPNDRLGNAVSLTDRNRDGRADLAIGVPGEDEGAGGFMWLPATATGITATGSIGIGATATGLATTAQYPPELGTAFSG